MNAPLTKQLTTNTLPCQARQRLICVVGPQVDKHHKWRGTIDSVGRRLQVVGTAAEALRLARTGAVDRWLISAELPDLSGIELCQMLRAQAPRAPIAVAAEAYSQELERAAYGARATLFVVKTANGSWLTNWLEVNQPCSAKQDG